MSLFDWMDKSIQSMKSYDISLIKIATAAAILLVAKYVPVLTSFDWYWYVLVFVIASIHPLKIMFSK